MRIVALVMGCLLAIPAAGLLFSGAVLGIAYAAQSEDGFFEVSLDGLDSSTVAITAEQIDLRSDPGTPQWVIDAIDADVRLRVTAADSGAPIFVGIAPEADLDAYLAGVAHDEIRDIENGDPRYRSRTGVADIAPPTEQSFWEVSASGSGTQEVVWEATSGQWAVAVMNADGSPGVAVDTDVGARADVIWPVVIGLLVVGALLAVGSIGLVLYGGLGLARASDEVPSAGAVGPLAATGPEAGSYPLSLEAELDPDLSGWQWLVKWFLAIPHLFVLFFLWTAFAVLTFVAGVAILINGRYPRGIFDFNVGVIRWSWRVSYYAFSGGLGTDRYPPFSLGPEPGYPARLDVAYPEQLSRGLVLVKWWLLALPHYVIVAILAGGGLAWSLSDDGGFAWGPTGGGLVALLTVIAAVILAFTGSYPRPLFDLIIGMNRWVYRVLAYAALMTDEYPPFRLDQGGSEPTPPRDPGPATPATGEAVELATTAAP